MIRFAGTFHQDNHGEWVKCMTEGGKPCSRHSGAGHIAGADLEDALAKAHEDDDFGMGDDMVAAPVPISASKDPSVSMGAWQSGVIHYDERATVDSVAAEFFPGVADSADEQVEARLISDFRRSWRAMPESRRTALREYTASMYEDMNTYLMADEDGRRHMDAMFKELSSQSLDETVSEMHHVFDTASTDRDMVVYRCRSSAGMPLTSRSGEEKACYEALDHGGVFMKSNFGSTTTDHDDMDWIWDLEDDATRYVIKVPRGSRGLYVDTVSENHGEHEFILDSNTKYRVVGIVERGSLTGTGGNWDKAPIIALEVVND